MSRVEHMQKVLELGFNIFELHGKVPPRGSHWPQDAAKRPVRTESYDIACENKIAVIDADTRPFAEWWYHNRPRTKWMVRTPRGGVHFIYPGETRNRQCDDYDVRGNGGYIVGVGSMIHGKVYELIGEITLDSPQFDPAWLPDSPAKTSTEPLQELATPEEDIVRRIVRARRFIAKIFSIEGEGGDRQLFRTASALIQKFNLPEVIAIDELRAWNQTNAKPPWPDHRLRYKIDQALKNKGAR